MLNISWNFFVCLLFLFLVIYQCKDGIYLEIWNKFPENKKQQNECKYDIMMWVFQLCDAVQNLSIRVKFLVDHCLVRSTKPAGLFYY